MTTFRVQNRPIAPHIPFRGGFLLLLVLVFRLLVRHGTTRFSPDETLTVDAAYPSMSSSLWVSSCVCISCSSSASSGSWNALWLSLSLSLLGGRSDCSTIMAHHARSAFWHHGLGWGLGEGNHLPSVVESGLDAVTRYMQGACLCVSEESREDNWTIR